MGKFKLVKDDKLELRGAALCCDNMSPLSTWVKLMQMTTDDAGPHYITWDIYKDADDELFAIPILEFVYKDCPVYFGMELLNKHILRKGKALTLDAIWPVDCPGEVHRVINCTISICVN